MTDREELNPSHKYNLSHHTGSHRLFCYRNRVRAFHNERNIPTCPTQSQLRTQNQTQRMLAGEYSSSYPTALPSGREITAWICGALRDRILLRKAEITSSLRNYSRIPFSNKTCCVAYRNFRIVFRGNSPDWNTIFTAFTWLNLSNHSDRFSSNALVASWKISRSN